MRLSKEIFTRSEKSFLKIVPINNNFVTVQTIEIGHKFRRL